MKLDIKKTFDQAITARKEGKLKEAEVLYRTILKTEPKHADANHNLGIILFFLNKPLEALILLKTAIEANPKKNQFWTTYSIFLIKEKRFDEAYLSCKKAIELKPNHVESHYNLGIALQELGKLKEAELSYKKTIELKEDYFNAYNNLGNTLIDQSKFEEAVVNYKKAIKLKPDYTEAYNNLSIVLQELGRLDEAEVNCKKAIELNPEFEEAHYILDHLLRQKELLLKINQAKKIDMKKKVTFFNKIFAKVFNFYSSRNNPNSNERLSKNPLILNRSVEKELLVTLYKMNCGELDKTKKGDARYGNGVCSDFKLFENGSPILKTVAEDLIRIMSKSVKSDIYIMDSFFNIIRKGGGTTPHKHLANFDKIRELDKKKFSLTYYLTVGDQNCTEPGILKLYNPMKEILPSEGTIVIIPAGRNHSAVYDGEKDRVMIGVNFYSLL